MSSNSSLNGMATKTCGLASDSRPAVGRARPVAGGAAGAAGSGTASPSGNRWCSAVVRRAVAARLGVEEAADLRRERLQLVQAVVDAVQRDGHVPRLRRRLLQHLQHARGELADLGVAEVPQAD